MGQSSQTSRIMKTVIRTLKDISEEAQGKIKYDMDEDEILGLKGKKADERNVTADDGFKLVSNLPPEVKMEPIFEGNEFNTPIAFSLQTISSSMAKVESSASISAQNPIHVPLAVTTEPQESRRNEFQNTDVSIKNPHKLY